MKTFRKISFIFLLIISIFVISLFNNFDIQVHAAEETNSFDNDLLINPAEYSGYGCTDGKDLKEENIDHDQNTVIEDNSGFGCGSTCGASREDGYSTTYQNGCRNWQVMPIISPLYKYWIDESSLSDLTDYQKALFIKYVDEAAAEWNSVRIADYDGKIVKLEKQSSNGLNVVPVRYNPNLDSGIAGQFNPVPLLHEIEIKRYNDYDTIMHEFGHMIGLQDLDLNNSPGTHISLMGYASDDKLHYQDIQGLAVANGKHTKHDFQKYWYDGTWYNYVCFYCDATDSVLTNWGGGSHLEMANTCIHDYRDLVSAGDRHWQKCTKCYKVIECEFRVNVLNSGDIEITGLIDDRTTITIPREIGGQKVVAIKANAFANLSNLQTVNFHYNCNITLIGNSAFKGCSNLTSISLPNTITNIDSSAFENCSYLQSVKLPTNLVAIGSSAFKGCGSLATITIPSGVTYIDSSAFENCSYLQSVTLPTNLVAIGSSAFKGCGSLGNITIPNSVTNIDSSAFENCSYLQTIILSSNLNAIGVSAFKGCGSLGSITIPSSVQYIDESAFENCVSLVSVIVEREISNITNLGNYAFAGCSSALQIIVPQNRVAEYKNKVYWSSYKNRIVANNDDFSEIELHCLSDFYNLTSLNVNYNKLYKLNVLCGKSYQIIADSNSDVKINLYDSNMNLISTNVNTLITYLGVNTYYIDMELENATSAEIVTTTFELRWEHDGERIYYNDEHNLLTHLHQLSNDTYFTKLYYINNNGAGFYKVQISGNTQNGPLLSTELGTISIYNNSDKTIDQLLNKYPNSNEYAITNVGQDTMYVYLPRNGYFYIDVMMPSNNYESLDLTISNVESETIDLLSSMTSTFTKDLTVDNNLDEFAKKLIINQTSKYLITLNSSDALSNNFDIIMFKQTFNSSSNVYKTYFKPINYITDASAQKSFEISLEAGVYFIYYYNNDTNANIDLTLTRILQNNSNRTYAMQADPVGLGYNPGSEVRFNKGLRNNYTITEGFTRNIYFVLEDFYTYSRLDFDWYSSNESIATVSEFGTVFANNVSSNQIVTIYAVYKEDPSLIYYRTFTVVDDTSEEEIVITCNMSYSYSEENGTYQIELNDMNSPYPWIQYYNWSVYVPCQENDISCSINLWGEITSSGPGYATLTGTYTINPRVTIIINLSIIE